jgi:serine/threonine protein kinase
MDKFEILKSIGSGAFGQVFLARHKIENKQYVIKKIKTKDMSEKDRINT